jgi:hypothetical protein
MSRGRHGAGLHDGVKVTNIRMDDLHHDIVRGVASALRHGVPATLLDGHASHRSLSSLVVVNQRRERIERLKGDLNVARRMARNCRDLAAQETDEQARQDYTEDVRRHTQRASAITREIEQLEEPSAKAAMPRTFDGEVGYILTGMSTLLTPHGRVSKEERQALRHVVRDFELVPGDGYVGWSLSLLLPAQERVLTLGPITGRVAVTGRTATPAELNARRVSAGAPAARRAVIHQLMGVGYPERIARSATLEPSGLLARVLLGEDVVWPGCEPAFDHGAFNAHLRASWPTDLAWASGVYVQTNPKRQALADVVAALGGEARLDQVRVFEELYQFAGNAIYVMTLPFYGRGNTCWPPTVERGGDWTAATGAWQSTLHNTLCALCGEPATAVVRVPEVPDALLCRSCRVMPSCPDLTFPRQYLDLALPVIEIPRDLLHSAIALPTGLRRKGPKPKQGS